MTQDLMDYPKMVEDAMRSVVREALNRAAENGLPGVHHFFITFSTQAQGVEISDTLVARFPDEMTIVLENQFWGLEISDDGFSVTLSFGGRQERLVIPFAALTAFVDPSVKFGLQFGEGAGDGGNAQETAPSVDDSGGEPAPETGDARVIPLDEFRKK